MKLRLLDAATDEMLDAAAYYQTQVDGLGQEFLDRLTAAFDEILDNPMLGSTLDPVHRKILLASRNSPAVTSDNHSTNPQQSPAASLPSLSQLS